MYIYIFCFGLFAFKFMENIMKKTIYQKVKNMALMLSLGAVMVLAVGCSSQSVSSTNNSSINTTTDTGKVSDNTTVDTDKDGIPDSAEVVLDTDPQNPDTDGDGTDDKTDKNPTQFDGTYQQSTGENGFVIQNVLVENNVDEATKKSAPDHLEIILQSKSVNTIKDFSVFYEFVDQVDGSKQSYMLPLTGFVLDAGETKSIHIDTTGLSGHFRANPNSSYYQSANAKDVKVIVSAAGYAAQEMSVQKDKGGAEMAD